jgi:hypothetical protein
MAAVDLDEPGFDDVIAALEPGTLVQVLLEVGNPEIPRDIRKAIVSAGAIIADTRARPRPREATVARRLCRRRPTRSTR